MSYTILLGNEPDADGDYRAEVRDRDDNLLHLSFRKDRLEALECARKWCDNYTNYDPTNVERIEYPGHSLRIA